MLTVAFNLYLIFQSVFRSLQTQWCSVVAWTKTEEVFCFFYPLLPEKDRKCPTVAFVLFPIEATADCIAGEWLPVVVIPTSHESRILASFWPFGKRYYEALCGVNEWCFTPSLVHVESYSIVVFLSLNVTCFTFMETRLDCAFAIYCWMWLQFYKQILFLHLIYLTCPEFGWSGISAGCLKGCAKLLPVAKIWEDPRWKFELQ